MKPMLAKNYDGFDPTDWWMSEKLDGVRAFGKKNLITSRNNKIFHAPNWFIKDLSSNILLDGELWIGRGKFDLTSGLVRRKINPNWNQIKYLVFDCVTENAICELRMQELRSLNLPDHVIILEQTKCLGYEHLIEFERKILSLGGEGVMLRKPCSMYEHKRSSSLLKVKRMKKGTAVVFSYQEGKGRNIGRVGALICLYQGKQILIGSGLSDVDRINPPKIGSTISFSFFELTDNNMPRFPSYIR